MHQDLNHYPLGDLRWSHPEYGSWLRGGRSLISIRPAPDMAIVFVHGWGGNASETWETFPEACRSVTEIDAFWFGYPSMDRSVSTCAAVFRFFLRDILARPFERIVNPSLPIEAAPRAPAGVYERVVLVGHSMGAIVIRKAMLSLEKEKHLNKQDREKMALLFFAPAHKGSSIPLLLSSGMGLDWLPGAHLVGMALLLHLRSLQELSKGSDFLKRLEEDSKEIRMVRMKVGEPYDYLRALVYHAEGDKVVDQDDFDDDYPMIPITKKRNHRNICKPDSGYEDPLQALENILNANRGE